MNCFPEHLYCVAAALKISERYPVILLLQLIFIQTLCLRPGGSFHPRGVHGEHANHCHLSEGRVLLQV